MIDQTRTKSWLIVLLLAATVSLFPQSVWAVVDEEAVNRLFTGKYRGGVKTSIAKPPAHLTKYTDVITLLQSLQSPPKNDSGVRQKYPGLRKSVKKTWPKQRVLEELANVQVKSCWIVAVKYEKQDDNDFHVIISDSPTLPFNRVMNVEVSGLPKTGPDRAKLTDVRRKFLSYFHLLGGSHE